MNDRCPRKESAEIVSSALSVAAADECVDSSFGAWCDEQAHATNPARGAIRFIGKGMGINEFLLALIRIYRSTSIRRHATLTLPEDLLIIHFIGAPLSSQLNRKVEDSYRLLSKLGPNDGLTTLVDELTPQGIAITELGLDHYYKHDHIDMKTKALLYTALELMEH